jgi:DNA-binding IclR family transcriptional regulator
VAKRATSTKGRKPPPTRALDRGLLILEAVAATPNMRLAEISEAVDLSPATTLRILETLRERDFVNRDDAAKTYRVGLKALEVGSKFLSETRLQETGRLLLQQLSDQTGQTVTMSILHSASVVFIDVVEGRGALRSTTVVGARVPVHATASGKALIAWKWEASLASILGSEPFDARTDHTITGLDALKSELAAVRQSGVAFDREELNLDITCIAAPVRNRGGEVIAAIAIQGLTRQVSGHETAFCHALRESADEMSQRLGWRPTFLQAQRDAGNSSLVD